MDEVGVVIGLRDDKAIVAVQKQSACDSCAAGGSCKAGEAGGAELVAINRAEARVGDQVKIEFTAYTYLKGSMIFYGIPAIALILGAVLGKDYLSRYVTGIDADSLSGIAGMTLFVLSFIVVRLIMKRFEKKRETIPVVVEVLGSKQNLPI